MLIVHHLGISQSERIVWLCEELEIAYELVHYDRDPKTPPVIVDGNLLLSESSAIIEYIIAKYSNNRFTLKADHLSFADYLF
ncbi:unnamed protein product [Adineta steineri]|uniref:GST N-terminal domain-containing protein n=1 Tax=Adineta steineri TaxID=433720 RepID=A0A814TGE2_9BILA|nr:unnamed protein product [Adineta steineri]CAF3880173.1 unnamed protein product [Adineta steineri]